LTLTEELEQTWHLNDKRTRLEFGEPDWEETNLSSWALDGREIVLYVLQK